MFNRQRLNISIWMVLTAVFFITGISIAGEVIPAAFEADTFAGSPPLTVRFTNKTVLPVSIPEEKIRWQWYFRENHWTPKGEIAVPQASGTLAPYNNMVASYDKDVSYTYTTPGRYTVTLAAYQTDRTITYYADGKINKIIDEDIAVYNTQKRNYITVYGIDFETYRTYGYAPFQAGFINRTVFPDDVDTSGWRWEWDFNGDGVVDSTLKDPSVSGYNYIYESPGYYTVSLKIKDSAGQVIYEKRKPDYITVNKISIKETRTIQMNVYTNNGYITTAPVVESINGMTAVPKGEDITLKFYPDGVYPITKVLVDGVETQVQGNSYIFKNITEDHTFAVGFHTGKGNPYTIKGEISGHGTALPSGDITAFLGEDIYINSFPERDYGFDGNGVTATDGLNRAYGDIYGEGTRVRFENITAPHSYKINFSTLPYPRRAYRTVDDMKLWETGMHIPKKGINPADIKYLGAFRVPDGYTDPQGKFVIFDFYKSWKGGTPGITYYPDGDPDNNDKYPGSLFGFGHLHGNALTEISIPEPVISPAKNLKDLPIAKTLQPFKEVTGFYQIESGWSGGYKTKGLTYSPDAPIDYKNRLVFGVGVEGTSGEKSEYPSIGMVDKDLTNLFVEGLWSIKYVRDVNQGSSIFNIPKEWADKYTFGRGIASGKSRSGNGTDGDGPSLFAIAPWKDTPLSLDKELSFTPLIRYEGVGFQSSDAATNIEDHINSNSYFGGGWVIDGDKSSVIYTSTSTYGSSWYGHPDDDSYRCQCYTNQKVTMMFYNTEDLAKVAIGERPSYFPQPYIWLDIGAYMFKDYDGHKNSGGYVRAMAVDHARGIIYLAENMADGDKPIIHMFSIRPQPTILPIASAGGDKAGIVNNPIKFDGSASKDPDGGIVGYYWNFGDGITAKGQIVEHSYAETGVYKAVLKVKDNSGGEAEGSVNITIEKPDTALKVLKISPLSPTILTLQFDRRVVKGEAETLSNYTITKDSGGVIIPISSVYMQHRSQLYATLTLAAPLEGNTGYTLTVKDIKDIYGISVGDSAPIPFLSGTGIHANWRFDEGAGDKAFDSSGHNFTGDILGGSSWQEGKIGKGLLLDGVDDYVNLGTAPSLAGNTDFSISLWVKTVSTKKQGIIEQAAPPEYRSYRLSLFEKDMRGGKYSPQGGLLYFEFPGTGLRSKAVIVDGNAVWHHIASVREGTKTSVYIDGNLDNIYESALNNLKTQMVTIGAIKGTGGILSDFFMGGIDEVQIYNRALMPEEILTLSMQTQDAKIPISPSVPRGVKIRVR